MVVCKNLDPVVYPSHDNLGREHIRHHSIVKDNMNLTVILNILVVRPQEPLAHKSRVPSDLMSPGTDGSWPNRFPGEGHPFDLFEVKDG
jgi:hypothetical protein